MVLRQQHFFSHGAADWRALSEIHASNCCSLPVVGAALVDRAAGGRRRARASAGAGSCTSRPGRPCLHRAQELSRAVLRSSLPGSCARRGSKLHASAGGASTWGWAAAQGRCPRPGVACRSTHAADWHELAALDLGARQSDLAQNRMGEENVMSSRLQ